MNKYRLNISSFVIFLVIIVIAGCIGVDSSPGPSEHTINTADIQNKTSNSESTWVSIPITDVISNKQTSILELASQEKPLIIHTFAVWCPACSMQLHETAKLMQENPDAYTMLGIDVDPREDSALIKRHVEKNQFSGLYVAAPPEMTRSLMSTLGSQIIQSLPQTIVVCNKSAVYIGDGVFREDKLKLIVSDIC